MPEVGFLEFGMLEVGFLEFGMLEVGFLKFGILEVSFAKIEASTVFFRYAILRAAEHIHDRLDVSSRTAWLRRNRLLLPFIRFGGGCVRCRSSVRGPFGGPRSLRSVLPHVSCKDFHNRAVVPLWRVPSDSFKCIDTTKAYFKPWLSCRLISRSELVDRARKTFGYLALFSELQRLLGAFPG